MPAPLLILRAVLGLEPDVPGGRLVLRPRLPAGERVVVRGLRIGSNEVTVIATGTPAEVAGAEGLEVEVQTARP